MPPYIRSTLPLLVLALLVAAIVAAPMLLCQREPVRPACLDLPGQEGRECIDRLLRQHDERKR